MTNFLAKNDNPQANILKTVPAALISEVESTISFEFSKNIELSILYLISSVALSVEECIFDVCSIESEHPIIHLFHSLKSSTPIFLQDPSQAPNVVLSLLLLMSKSENIQNYKPILISLLKEYPSALSSVDIFSSPSGLALLTNICDSEISGAVMDSIATKSDSKPIVSPILYQHFDQPKPARINIEQLNKILKKLF